ARAVRLPAERQREAGDGAEAALERAGQQSPLLGIVDRRALRIDVRRQRLLLPEVVEHVLPAGEHEPVGELEATAERPDESFRVADGVAGGALRIGDRARVSPDRHTVVPPVAAERPARQHLTRVPLPLAEEEQTARCEALAEAPRELLGESQLDGA